MGRNCAGPTASFIRTDCSLSTSPAPLVSVASVHLFLSATLCLLADLFRVTGKIHWFLSSSILTIILLLTSLLFRSIPITTMTSINLTTSKSYRQHKFTTASLQL